MASMHLGQRCKHIPQNIRDELVRLKEEKTLAQSGKKFWGDGARVLGVKEDDDCLGFEKLFNAQNFHSWTSHLLASKPFKSVQREQTIALQHDTACRHINRSTRQKNLLIFFLLKIIILDHPIMYHIPPGLTRKLLVQGRGRSLGVLSIKLLVLSTSRMYQARPSKITKLKLQHAPAK